jgi:hypothetical protein
MPKTIRKRARKSRTPESGVLTEALQCLRDHRILAFRMNVGMHKIEGRYIKYGVSGMGDILAFPSVKSLRDLPEDILDILLTKYASNLLLKRLLRDGNPQPLWVEVKALKGKQTPNQSVFQQVVEADGHWYVVVRSYEELEAYLRSKGVIR